MVRGSSLLDTMLAGYRSALEILDCEQDGDLVERFEDPIATTECVANISTDSGQELLVGRPG